MSIQNVKFTEAGIVACFACHRYILASRTVPGTEWLLKKESESVSRSVVSDSLQLSGL